MRVTIVNAEVGPRKALRPSMARVVEILPLPLILLAAFIRHASALRAPFFADDFLFLEQVRGKSLLGALLSPDPIGNFLRPVSRQLYFWAVGLLSGEAPTAYHALNLLAFLIVVSLLYLVVRRIAGPVAAAVAAAYVGLHYAADVPVLWASGSQDLLAILFSLCAVYALLRGHSLVASGALALGLLSKETVIFTAPIALAVLASVNRGTIRDALRKCLPLFGVTAIWAAVYLLSLPSRPSVADGFSFDLPSILATLLHLPQVALGFEFPGGRLFAFQPGWSALAPLACVTLAVWIQLRQRQDGRAQPDLLNGRGLLAAGVWTLAGVLPVLAVGPIWSAYFYLFALCGVGIAAGVLAARARPAAVLLGLGLFALSNDSASNLKEFAGTQGAADSRSHVNAFYIRRSTDTVARYLAQMKAARPTLPARSTVFFGNVPGSLGWQAGNGPLVRWAYKDSTLRSYYLTEFSLERARRGPFYFLAVEDGHLVDKSDDPMLLHSLAFSSLLSDKHAAARDALTLLRERYPNDREIAYWLVLAQLGSKNRPVPGAKYADVVSRSEAMPGAARRTVEGMIAARDSAAAISALLTARMQYLLDPWPHARLAALTLGHSTYAAVGVVEAYAYHVLAPQDADAWRKWASAQLAEGQLEQALGSLDRYFALGGLKAQQDDEAKQVRQTLARALGGSP